MVEEKDTPQNNAYTIGILLIFLGVIFLLAKLGVFKTIGVDFDITNLWPIVLIIFGADIIYANRNRK